MIMKNHAARSFAATLAIIFALLHCASCAQARETDASSPTHPARTAASPADASVPRYARVDKKPWVFDKFPIIAWWGPPGTAQPVDFKRYRDAGFTIYAANPDSGFDRAMRMASAAGLDIMAFRQTQGFGLPDRRVRYTGHPSEPIGWFTHDEPHGPEAVDAAIREVHALMTQDPTRYALFNMLPPFAQGDPDTETVIDRAVAEGMPILSYDHYIMMADGATRDQAHYDNLDLFRRKSLEHDVPFWAFAMTIKHYRYRRPSESDVRYKQFTNLAYGAKGLWYFTYWGPVGWHRWDDVAIVDPRDGQPTDLYDVVKGINHAVLQVGDLLLDLTSVEVVHNHPAPGHKRFQPKTSWIAGIDAKDAVIGFFKDEQGNDYAWVVNKRHGPGQSASELADTITLTFDPTVVGVDALSWLDGQTGPLSLQNQKAKLTIAGGTGVLLRPRVDKDRATSVITRLIMELPEPTADYSRRLVAKVADWQIDHLAGYGSRGTRHVHEPAGWVRGALMTGIMAVYRTTQDQRYLDVATELAEINQWKLGDTLDVRHADDHTIGQLYTELYEVQPDLNRIADTRARFDQMIADPKPGRVDYWWCDALFMAPPAYARLSRVTGDPKYLEFTIDMWKDATEFLYDKEQHLYFRDRHYFNKKERNGESVFWSRGNGWVFGGLVRVLQYMPEDHPDRPYFIRIYREMADKIVSIQDGRDGLWRSGLLDPEFHIVPEASGSGFFCFGLAWGVNNGVLTEPRYEQAAKLAWKGLTGCVYPDGGMGYVQRIGAGPDRVQPGASYEYGVGAFLLAGEEMIKLLENE
ncbi:glycoside hydrolase family 88/105 protein [Mucisphaera calidilacus]|uniref:Unsaturated rhamnogalacturonyl hydrolase YteR n=1 Tax=Mucisphaera calidilacus TaxID=2527982 RepID=A0A518BWV5_9BACT|nr:glycoside hydrolase family 88 protein [Mucisphaera calidilacus]QDU71455.1 Unsaturated rhamnogalacturonyl hydrolase YteR [Mucisphaera calidilacus]